MACTCQQNPCVCGLPECIETRIDLCDKVNPDWPATSICNGDISNNIWYTPGPNGKPGQCKLDTMTYEQVEMVLKKVPYAKKDLLRVTTDEMLVRLANSTKLIIPEKEENEQVSKRLSGNLLPYYTIFRGRL